MARPNHLMLGFASARARLAIVSRCASSTSLAVVHRASGNPPLSSVSVLLRTTARTVGACV